jgi:hypothetical protein
MLPPLATKAGRKSVEDEEIVEPNMAIRNDLLKEMVAFLHTPPSIHRINGTTRKNPSSPN